MGLSRCPKLSVLITRSPCGSFVPICHVNPSPTRQIRSSCNCCIIDGRVIIQSHLHNWYNTVLSWKSCAMEMPSCPSRGARQLGPCISAALTPRMLLLLSNRLSVGSSVQTARVSVQKKAWACICYHREFPFRAP